MERTSHGTGLDRANKIAIITSIVLIGFLAAITFHAIMGYVFHLGYPYNSFLFSPQDSFMDFFNMLKIAKTHTLDGVYLPFSFLLLRPFTFFDVGNYVLSKRAYYMFALIFISYFLWYNYVNIKSHYKNTANLRNIFILSFLTYPFIFAIDRGNNEMLVFIFISLFVYLYQKGKVELSILPLALAIAMKLVPVIFLVLFIADKKYKETAATIALAAMISFIGFMSFHGTIYQNLIGLSYRLHCYNLDYLIKDGGLAYNSTLYGLLKYTLYSACPNVFLNNLKNIAVFLRWYSVFAGAALLALFAYILLIETVFWKKVLLIVLAFILLPGVTADYRLLYLFIPMYLFVNDRHKDKYDVLYSVIFSFLLIPKNYFYIPRPMHLYYPFYMPYPISNISISILLNPIAIIILIFLVMSNGFRTKFSAIKGGSND